MDVVIHSGGISQRSRLIDTVEAVDRAMMEVNYYGTLAFTRALLPHMIAAGGVHFAVVTSVMGLFSAPLRSGYARAKHAMHGWFEALRAEHQPAILRGIDRNRPLVTPGKKKVLGYWLSRFASRLLRRIARRAKVT